MSENEIRERLVRIEGKLETLIEQKNKDTSETTKRRDDCDERFQELETYVIEKKATDKTKSESALSKSALSNFSEIIKTVATVIAVLVTMKILNF